MRCDPETSPRTRRVLDAMLRPTSPRHYGYALSVRTGLGAGGLYPILACLAEHGLLEARWEPPSAPTRRSRHSYCLTPEGRRRALRSRALAPSGSPALFECATPTSI